MDVREGFIISVFNYCDRWCEICPFTSRCRMFAHVTHDEASGSEWLPRDVPLPPVKWLEDVLVEMNALAGVFLTGDELAACRPQMSVAHAEIYERAKAYCLWAHDCVGPLQSGGRPDASDPLSVIAWFSSLNASKIRYALTGLAEFDGNREFPPDHEGAAKVALLGIDRSCSAWHQLIAERRLSAAHARPCLEELAWIRDRLEAAIPEARSFVRPGFDEPRR